jgi:hypothetical protein
LGLFSMPVLQVALPAVGVATFQDARRSISDETRFAVALGERLHELHTGHAIALLTGYNQAQRIMISSGLPLRQFHIVYDPAGEDIVGSLLHSARYLVIGKARTPESRHFVDDWLKRRDELLRYYNVTFEDSHHVLFERKLEPFPSSDPGPLARPAEN